MKESTPLIITSPHSASPTSSSSASSPSPSLISTVKRSISSTFQAVRPQPNSRRRRFWEAHSSTFRFFVLCLAIVLPFGGHIVKSSLSSLATDILADDRLGITHAQFGAFQSALSLPNLFVPFIGGIMLDLRRSQEGALLFLSLCLIGQVGFALALGAEHPNFHVALFTRALFGFGQGSTVVAQSRLISRFFVGRELIFAVALCESAHNISGFVARVCVVPWARWFGTYVAALWMTVFFCAFSLVSGIILLLCVSDADAEATYEEIRDSEEQSSSSSESRPALDHGPDHNPQSLAPLLDGHVHRISQSSPPTIFSAVKAPFSKCFLLLCFIHLLTSNYAHLFDYISANFLHITYGFTISSAAWLSSVSSFVSIFLCPLASLWLDRYGYKMYVVAACAMCSSVAYLLMVFTSIPPLFPLLLLTLSIAFVPTILRSAVPDLIDISLYGTAYGAYGVFESFGAVIGHITVGAIVDKTDSYLTDLLLFAGMAAAASVLAILLTFIDRHYQGTLNLPSAQHFIHVPEPSTTNQKSSTHYDILSSKYAYENDEHKSLLASKQLNQDDLP